ncbi:LOW QUALITY PROTEIN: hypothetical protein PHMEG_00016346, partial [Phytophthora megakarya]
MGISSMVFGLTYGLSQYIIASQATGSRTIVHSRTIAELTCEAFTAQVDRYRKEVCHNANAPVWFHFEGRNMEIVRKMMLYVRENVPHAKISVEIEFPRYPWTLAKTLASLADYVFMSKDYLRDNIGITSADTFFDGILTQQWDENWNQWIKAFVCPWGSDGVYYLAMAGSMTHHIPASQLDSVVESNGAGDTFIGATLAGLSRGSPLHQALTTACDVATVKCLQRGFALPPDKVLIWQRSLHNVNDEERKVDTHSVTSEVQLELKQVQCTIATDSDSVQIFAVSLLSVLEEDNDGDVILPRRQRAKRRKPSKPVDTIVEGANRTGDGSIMRGTDTIFVLEANSRTTWNTAGTQLWRAAFLLAEYIYSEPEHFADQTVLELGCGIGFTSIVASRFCRCVYATDSDNNALLLAKKNAEHNRSGDMRPRLLDWDDRSFKPIAVDSSATMFVWSPTDETELKDLTTIIASDVFYDDTTTTLFLLALRRLMLQHNRAKCIVSAERRSVFSASAMRVVSLGYDTFQDHVCLHEPITCHTRVCENRIQCRMCNASSDGTDLLRFVVHELSINDFPQRFKYDRMSTLKLWKIDSVFGNVKNEDKND